MQSRSPLSTEIDAILQYRWFYYSITIPKLQEKCLQIDSRWRGPPPCGGPLFLMGHFRQVFLLEPQKEPKRVPLLPIAREARLKGAWVRALRERFASAPLRIQERTDWPLPAANTLQWNCSQFLFLVAAFWQFVGGGVLDAPFRPRRGQCGGRRKSVKKNAALLHFLAFLLTDHRFGVLRGE